MKRFLLPILLLSALWAGAQAYNNEWIDYSKTYYKFEIASNGLYRIGQPVLSGAGLGCSVMFFLSLSLNASIRTRS